ncbi:DUF6801 domain-containing protein [Nocardioides nitrophenolicus]|uniref:DUF6801 domain-containing protein n=1 Tax=Nocardioides nitrophenolicus TaxID=60489 RepID=UPI001958A4D5|nr:DUF6801 domain-containing protein [Nocardioides nitrophenolicus]MBM7515300.1 hypothetical protein [Nocardioides nitrophenolicus]
MTVPQRTLRSVSAGAVLGLAATTAVVLGTSTPASAAAIDFDCALPIGGTDTFTADITTNAPATIPAGTSITPMLNVALTVPEGTADLLRLFQPDQVGGTVQGTTLVDGVARTTTITVPPTAVPASGPIVVSGTGTMAAITAGTEGASHQIAAGNQAVTITIYKTGQAPTPIDVPCTPAAGSNRVISTIGVTAAPASTTTVKAKYAKKARKAKVSATVSAPGATPAGTVTFTLKKGKQVKTKTVAVTAGRAKAVFKKVTAKGRYTVTASYTGTVGASTGTTKLKVR